MALDSGTLCLYNVLIFGFAFGALRSTSLFVIARFMRAMQFLTGGRKMGCPDKRGNDGNGSEALQKILKIAVQIRNFLAPERKPRGNVRAKLREFLTSNASPPPNHKMLCLVNALAAFEAPGEQQRADQQDECEPRRQQGRLLHAGHAVGTVARTRSSGRPSACCRDRRAGYPARRHRPANAPSRRLLPPGLSGSHRSRACRRLLLG